MATYKQLNSRTDIKVSKSNLTQLFDGIESDISGSNTRKKYQVFVTGGVGPGVTSSIFQTVFDQDFTLQTANAVCDMTVGLFSGSDLVATASTGIDTSGKLLFPSQSLMMREKISNYRQFAKLLLGNSDSRFTSPLNNPTTSDNIDEAFFINFKRLFSRDGIKRDTFAMRMYQSASHEGDILKPNIYQTSESGSAIFSDVGSSTTQLTVFGSPVGNIVDANNTARKVGLIFYQHGICVLDLKKVTSGSQFMSGAIPSITSETVDGKSGRVCLGSSTAGSNRQAKFIPDFLVSGSIDTIVDHVASTRLGSGSLTAMTFQNITNINSTLVFCRATADEFNYSSNPTYVNRDTNRIVVIEKGSESTQKAFSYFTTVGLYDDNDNLVAVAKMSRPIEKNDEKDLTVRVRLDF